MMRTWSSLGLVLWLGCASGGAGSDRRTVETAVAPVPRHQIVPRVEHHQHLVGPTAIEPPPASLPIVAVPPEIEGVLRERKRVSGSTSPSTLYTDDALILDVATGEDHWARGREAAQKMAKLHPPESNFLPTAWALSKDSGYVAGVVRMGESPADDMHFTFGLRREQGAWRIAVEMATNKPPPTFSKPVTADMVVERLDEAGIERAVVLSVAYWFGSALEETPVENELEKTRGENDWVVSEVARYPERLVAFCGVNPLKDYAIGELERCSKLPGVKGMKLHFGNSGIDLRNPDHVAKVRAFFAAANERGMAIVAHLWTLDPSYGREHSQVFLDQVLPAAPDVTVQIAHLAGAGRYVHDDAMEVFANAVEAGDPRTGNLYFDLTTVVTEEADAKTLELIVRRLRQVGLERVLFGSDTILPDRPPPLLAWAMVRRRLPLTDEELRIVASNQAPYLRD